MYALERTTTVSEINLAVKKNGKKKAKKTQTVKEAKIKYSSTR